jgi:hypothetical protein
MERLEWLQRMLCRSAVFQEEPRNEKKTDFSKWAGFALKVTEHSLLGQSTRGKAPRKPAAGYLFWESALSNGVTSAKIAR